MKYLTLFILLTGVLSAAAQPGAKHYPYRPIRTITTDLNNDNKPDTIPADFIFKRKKRF
jgi:hypothetical protein